MAQTLQWVTTKAEAVATAQAQGKYILLLAGKDVCSHCKKMKGTVAESTNPPIRDLLRDNFILWYSRVDQVTDYKTYSKGLTSGWTLPLICVIDPNNPDVALDRTTNEQTAAVFYQRLLAFANNRVSMPKIAGFQPESGMAGDVVTIFGSNLVNVTQVLFNGIAATFSTNSELQAVVPASATTGPITVTTSTGSAASTIAFTVLKSTIIEAVITGFDPPQGAAGTLVRVFGVNFNQVTNVLFNGVPAAFTTTDENTVVHATVPATAASGPITVMTATNGIAVSTKAFVVPVDPSKQTLVWYSTKSEAVAAAKAQGKYILLLAGKDICSHCKKMKGTVAESLNPPIKALLLEHFVLWYSQVDKSRDYKTYSTGLASGWTLPLISVLDPNNPNVALDRTTNEQTADAFYQRLLAYANVRTSLPSLVGFEPSQGRPGTEVTLYGNNLLTATKVLFNGVEATFTATGQLKAVVPAAATTGLIRVVTPMSELMTPQAFTVIEDPQVDLQLAQTASLMILNGQIYATFTMVMTNLGPDLASGVRLTNGFALSPMEDITQSQALTNLEYAVSGESVGTNYVENGVLVWEPGDLAAGANATLTVILNGVSAGRLTALGGASSIESDTDLTNNVADAYVDIPSAPVLRVQRDQLNNYQVVWTSPDVRWVLQATSLLGGSGNTGWRNIISDNIQVLPDGTHYYTVPVEAMGLQLFRLVFQMP